MNQTGSSGRISAIAPMLTPHPPRRKDLIPIHGSAHRRAGGQRVDQQVGTRTASPIAHPGFERLCAVGQHVDPATIPLTDAVKSTRVARDSKNLRDAHSQCEQDGADAERARGPEDYGGCARPSIARAQGSVQGSGWPKPRTRFKADAVRKFHQRSHRREHELGQAAIRILFEHACRAGTEAKVALEGHGIACDRFAAAARLAAAARTLRIHIHPIARRDAGPASRPRRPRPKRQTERRRKRQRGKYGNHVQ